MLLTEEHHNIRKTVRDFAEREIRPVARELDEKAEFSIPLTKRMGELGFFGIRTSQEYGGLDLDTLAYVIAVEELARVDSSQAATLAAHISLGIGPIMNYGSREQKEKYLPVLSSGEGLWAFGLTEPDAGSDSRGTKTSARLEGDQWVINGSRDLYHQRCVRTEQRRHRTGCERGTERTEGILNHPGGCRHSRASNGSDAWQDDVEGFRYIPAVF